MLSDAQKPKALLFREAIVAAEGRIVAALPDLLDALIARARDGDTKAAVYLLDRVLGRPTGLKFAPPDDQRLPFSEDDAEEAVDLAAMFALRSGVNTKA